MAGLCAPLPTLRCRPHGRPRTARGRCGSLLRHRVGLAPTTRCRSPGALRKILDTTVGAAVPACRSRACDYAAGEPQALPRYKAGRPSSGSCTAPRVWPSPAAADSRTAVIRPPARAAVHDPPCRPCASCGNAPPIDRPQAASWRAVATVHDAQQLCELPHDAPEGSEVFPTRSFSAALSSICSASSLFSRRLINRGRLTLIRKVAIYLARDARALTEAAHLDICGSTASRYCDQPAFASGATLPRSRSSSR